MMIADGSIRWVRRHFASLLRRVRIYPAATPEPIRTSPKGRQNPRALSQNTDAGTATAVRRHGLA
jgi:hypothetical protein